MASRRSWTRIIPSGAERLAKALKALETSSGSYSILGGIVGASRFSQADFGRAGSVGVQEDQVWRCRKQGLS